MRLTEYARKRPWVRRIVSELAKKYDVPEETLLSTIILPSVFNISSYPFLGVIKLENSRVAAIRTVLLSGGVGAILQALHPTPPHVAAARVAAFALPQILGMYIAPERSSIRHELTHIVQAKRISIWHPKFRLIYDTKHGKALLEAHAMLEDRKELNRMQRLITDAIMRIAMRRELKALKLLETLEAMDIEIRPEKFHLLVEYLRKSADTRNASCLLALIRSPQRLQAPRDCRPFEMRRFLGMLQQLP